MEGLKEKRYLTITRKRFDPIGLLFSVSILTFVVLTIGGIDLTNALWDSKSFIIVIGGTFSIVLFQFDLSTTLSTVFLIIKSLWSTPEKNVINISKQLDEAIINNIKLSDLRDANKLNGEILNDVIYMKSRGLLFDEIDSFITAKISENVFRRKASVDLLRKASIISPSLGLFGTVIGLIGVLKTLSSPDQIGPNMSLALMTTAYGAGLATLIFTPLAGRLEHHNEIYVEIHKQILSKIGVILIKEEKNIKNIEQKKINNNEDK